MFQLETGIETIQVIKEAYTYVNIIPSPLHVVLLDGSPTKVSRGIMFPRVFWACHKTRAYGQLGELNYCPYFNID